MLSTENVLFIDTECVAESGTDPLCIQTLFNNEIRIFYDFNDSTYSEIKSLWDKAEAVVIWNALYDLGFLSSLFDNTFKWVDKRGMYGAYWELNVFGNKYRVKKIGGFRNLITPMNKEGKKSHKKGVKSTPVIDLLKLWSILIDESDGDGQGSYRLKNLLKKYKYPGLILDYSEDNVQTREYQEQDVLGLEYLCKLFLDKIKDVLNLVEFSWAEWGFIKSPATFTKLAYERRYPMLKQWKEANSILISREDKLKYALEKAYNGGITLALHRGKLENTGWVDIKSAYANTIRHFNTDRYLLFDFKKFEGDQWDYQNIDCLVIAEVNFCIVSMNKSLKIFKVKKPTIRYMWYNDIVAAENLCPDFRYKVLGGYKFIPKNNVKTSLVEEWVNAKEEPGLKKKNKTLYDYYKFLSNTSYGIKAQREPFETVHTNMVIAGMITANVHKILSVINKTVSDFGYEPVYNDTDSCCFVQGRKFNAEDMNMLLDSINRRIDPFLVEGEGYNKTTQILSLKRYISEGGEDKDKIKLHGKGRYNINRDDAFNYVKYKTLPDKQLEIRNISATTQRTMNQLLKLAPQYAQNQHPFMFITDVKTDRSIEDFFTEWYNHCDTKTWFPEDADADTEFKRPFRIFTDFTDAMFSYGETMKLGEQDDMQDYYRDWDKEIEEDFTLE